MQVEVPPIYETQLTGFIGQCENTVRGKVYAVRLTYGEAPRCSVDGVECAATVNVYMLRLVKSARKFFGV
jgi:hypothetical protein